VRTWNTPSPPLQSVCVPTESFALRSPVWVGGLRLFADAPSSRRTSIRSVEASAAAPLDVDWICAWQEEMRRALRRRESLPASACGALARLLERFLDDEPVERGNVEEVRTAIALLTESSQRSGPTFSSG
jgi:hypothetical protein